MADTRAPELPGKGKRVAGVFLFMIGASIVLDTHALWLGMPTLACGAAVFAWGVAETRTTEPVTAPRHDATSETRL
jgi:predicted tellurium resistance membrane protein TerC